MSLIPLVTLEQAKGHLRVVSNVEDDDIALKLSAASELAVRYLDRPVYATADALQTAVLEGTAGDEAIVCTDMIRAGILLILGDMYANREDVVTGTIATQLPTGARACLRLLRRQGC